AEPRDPEAYLNSTSRGRAASLPAEGASQQRIRDCNRSAHEYCGQAPWVQLSLVMHVRFPHLSFRIIHASPQLVHDGFHELTVRDLGSYARSTMTRLAVLIMAVIVTDIVLDLPGAKAESEQKTNVVVTEDYALYDQVLTNKFLTSQTQLVVI